MGLGALLPVLPLYVDGPLDAGKTELGVVIAATAPAAILLQPVLGRLADRRGRRAILIGGPLLWAACVALFPFADSLLALLALRAISGIGEGAMIVAPATVANDIAPESRRGEAVSIFSLSVWGGLTAGPPLGELVLRDTHFTAAWRAIAGVALGGAALGTLIGETRPPQVEHRRGPRISRAAVIPGFVIAGQLAGYAAIASFTALYARELGMSGAGLVFALNGAVVMTIRGLGRRIPDRLGARRGAAWGLSGAAAGLALIALVHHPAGLYGGSALFFAGHSLIYPALMMLVVSRTPEHERSAALGLFGSFSSVGFAAGAVLLGALASAGGYRAAFAAAAFIVAFGLVPISRVRHRQPRSPEEPGLLRR
jgi:MFS family permease